MQKKLLVVMSVALITSIMVSFTGCGTKTPAETSTAASTSVATESSAAGSTASSNLEESLKIDVSNVKGSDGQILLKYGVTRDVAPKPTEKTALDMWNIEYAGRQTVKEPMIASPKTGIIGKRVIMIQQSEHPYWTAVSNGAKTAADAFKVNFEMWNPNGDLNQQNQFIDKAIAEKVDFVLLAPLDAKAGVQQFKKLYDAGIPAMPFNMIPTDEAMKYAVAISAPDDFGQFRLLAESLAKSVNGKGGVAYITHIPGGSPYFARTVSVQNFYKEKYPDMKTLDTQSPGFDAPKCKQVVADWITRFGKDLTCIVCADDSAQALGVTQALEEAGRTDIKVVAAGNSKVGMDLVKAGKVFAITYQSAEADGAIPMKIVADYFNGIDLGPNAAFFLPQAIITKENVDSFMPAQW
ncbi:MAG TPA: sugar ABC transporter substrate-binding protein [Ruminiclostridium sp.]